ncbi:MAG: ATP-binding protein, partial [Anaerolineales bacterium]
MPRLAVCLLGSFQVYWGGKPLAGLPTDKTRALLAYLAVESKSAHRRDALAELLWPMRPPSAALNNLRQALYLLRGAIHDREVDPPHLLITHHELQLNPDSDFWLDTDQFETVTMSCLRHHPGDLQLCEACLQRLLPAVELFRGEFLAGLSLPDCLEFDWWLLARQEIYHHLALEALDRLARHFEQARDYLQVSRYAQKAIELEPWRESSHRIKMRALANTGNPQEALHQFGTCKQILNQELGIDPSRKTIRLYQKIIAQTTGRTIKPRQSILIPATGTQATTPERDRLIPLFAGREKELGQLTNFLEHALAGSGRVIMVTGEAGSGKSALVSEFTRRILPAYPDLLVAVGSCHAYTGRGDSNTPFIQILRRLDGEADFEQQALFQNAEYDARLRQAHPQVVGALSSFGAEWSEFLRLRESSGGQDQAHTPSSLRSQKTRPRSQNYAMDMGSSTASLHPAQLVFFDQYVQILRSLARHYPLVLVLEDLHWADSSTLGLLFHLGRNLAGRRILVIGTYRSEAQLAVHIGPDQAVLTYPALGPILKEFQLMFGEIEVDLAQADGREFIANLLAREPNELPGDFNEKIYQYSEGHALFTVELLRSLQERGEIYLNPDGYWTAVPKLEWDFIPTKVEAVIADRLSRLTPAQQELLRCASIQGVVFCPEILTRVSGSSTASIQHNLSNLAGVQRVISAEDLQWHGDKCVSSYRFCHSLYQKYLYRLVDLVERKRLHAATALQLEAQSIVSGKPDTSNLLQIAWHYEVAGQARQAAHTLQKAGSQEYLAGANTAAAGHFKHALALLQYLPATPERDQHELSLQLALSAPLRSSRGYADQEAGRAYARACELALRLGDTNRYCLASFLLHSYYTSRADYKQAMELSWRMSQLVKAMPQAAECHQANFCLGVTNLLLGKFAPAWEQLSAASAANPFEDDTQLISPIGRDVSLMSRIFLTWLYWMRGETKKAQYTSQSVLQQAQMHRHPYSQAFSLAISGCIVNLFAQNYRAVQAQAEALIQLSGKTGFDMLHALAIIFSGRVQVANGELEAGLHAMQGGLMLYQSTGHKMFRTFLLGQLAEAYLVSGEPQQSLKTISFAEQTLLECGERFYEAELRRIKAAVLFALAESQSAQDSSLFWEQAENSLQRSLQVARWQGARAFELRAALDYSKKLLEKGQTQQALALLEGAYESLRHEVDLPELL